MTIQREQPVPGWTPPPKSRWDRVPGPAKSIGVLVIIAALAAVIVVLVGGGDDKPPHKSATPPPQNTERKAGEAAGVVFSPIASTAGGTKKLDGYPIGFPHTKTGATEAAFSYIRALNSPAAMSDSTARELIRYMAPNLEWSTWRRVMAGVQKRNHLSSDGEVLRSDGTVDPSRKYISLVLLRYGVFAVDSYNSERAKVYIWAPTVAGRYNDAKDGNRLAIGALIWKLPLYWSHGDWRLEWSTSGVGASSEVQPPGGDPAVSFRFRAKNSPASRGWKVTADATQSRRIRELGGRVIGGN